MLICEGCNASYEENFKFCPHCGKAKRYSSHTLVQSVKNYRISRNDVFMMLSRGGGYSQRLVKETLLGERHYEPVYRASLAGVDLSGLDLSNLDLSGVNFKGANFSGANLSNASLRHSLVSYANLAQANLA